MLATRAADDVAVVAFCNPVGGQDELGFDRKATSTLCREARMARGEFVEPAVFWSPLALAFDVPFWPIYAWANIYHDGTPFAPPYTH